MFKLFRRAASIATPEAPEARTAADRPLCPETGLPYGEPGTNERVAWIFAMADLEDAEERALRAELAS